MFDHPQDNQVGSWTGPAQTCVTIASRCHPDLDTSGPRWTDLDPMTVSCGGDAGTRTRTGVSPSDFKSRALSASRAREGRFYPLLQSSCVTIARDWHPSSDSCNTRPLSAPHLCPGSPRGGGQGGPVGATCRAVLSGAVPGKAKHPRRGARGRGPRGLHRGVKHTSWFPGWGARGGTRAIQGLYVRNRAPRAPRSTRLP